jgi:hypothetical protein
MAKNKGMGAEKGYRSLGGVKFIQRNLQTE